MPLQFAHSNQPVPAHRPRSPAPYFLLPSRLLTTLQQLSTHMSLSRGLCARGGSGREAGDESTQGFTVASEKGGGSEQHRQQHHARSGGTSIARLWCGGDATARRFCAAEENCATGPCAAHPHLEEVDARQLLLRQQQAAVGRQVHVNFQVLGTHKLKRLRSDATHADVRATPGRRAGTCAALTPAG